MDSERIATRYDPEQSDWVMAEGLPDPMRFYRHLTAVTGGMGLIMLPMEPR